MSNRREFVTAVAGGALLAPLLPGAAQADTVATRPGGTPKMAVFQSLQGEVFEVWRGLNPIGSVRLMTVREVPSRQPLEQFTLVLAAASGPLLSNGRYRLLHAQSGRVEAWLDRSGRRSGVQLYRVDFSLLI